MITATMKATGEKVYYFASESQPGTWHKTQHVAGKFVCSCKGYQGYHHCWHVKQVAALATAALKAAKVQQQPYSVVAEAEQVAALAEASADAATLAYSREQARNEGSKTYFDEARGGLPLAC